MVTKTGLQIAIDETIRISKFFSSSSDKKLKEQLIFSVFDDQLKAHTGFNRQQRRKARVQLKKAIKKYDAE